MDKVDITIIGAGVVGLAIAAELSRRYDNIVVLERLKTFGQETSSRNSEVVHSGIYYPLGSLKARLCVEGARRLYEYCEETSVPHSRLGKLIVAATHAEIAQLHRLYETGLRNGVEGLTLLGKDEVAVLEPNVNAFSALYSSNTGIVDSHTLMSRLYSSAGSHGVLFSFDSEVNYIKKDAEGYIVGIDKEGYRFISSVVINSAGLYADRIAAMAGIDVDTAGYRLRYCKGSYFSYSKPAPVKTLVYPLPGEGLLGLGVHATLDLGGRLRFGPDTEYVSSIDYSVDASKRDAFYDAARRIIHGLEKESFQPDMAGIRPKLVGRGFRDFIINHEAERGLPGLINLVGIESPGLTACLAIARDVSGLVRHLL